MAELLVMVGGMVLVIVLTSVVAIALAARWFGGWAIYCQLWAGLWRDARDYWFK